MGYYSAFKKEIPPFATTQLNLENMLSEISQIQKEKKKHYIISLTCIILKSQILKREQNCGYQGWGRGNREMLIESTNLQLCDK